MHPTQIEWAIPHSAMTVTAHQVGIYVICEQLLAIKSESGSISDHVTVMHKSLYTCTLNLAVLNVKQRSSATYTWSNDGIIIDISKLYPKIHTEE
jgi:hypothetical protein